MKQNKSKTHYIFVEDEYTHTQDKRFPKALSCGSHKFVDVFNKEHNWNVLGILGFGGSGIVYEVCSPTNPSQRYAMKEYFPLSLSEYAIRDGTQLTLDDEAIEIWSKGLETFSNEKEIQRKLPPSNSELGRLFVYSSENFCANNTAYIISDTGHWETLEEYMDIVYSSIKNEKAKKIGVSYLKTVLHFTIDVCRAIHAIHQSGYLHLDISDTNIMVDWQRQTARINDYASAVPYDIENNKALLKSRPSYTPSFSPIEQKSASFGNERRVLSTATDTYAICAVLYRCLFNSEYDPAYGLPDIPQAPRITEAPRIPLCPAISDYLAWKLFEIIKHGLKGQENRFQSADTLKWELLDFLCLVEKNEKALAKTKHMSIGILLVGITLVVIMLSIYATSFYLYPKPNIAIYSDITDNVYYDGETIELCIAINDKGLIDSYELDQEELVHNIETMGFTADKSFYAEWDTDNNCVRYMLQFSNISLTENGEKTILINDIYSSKWFSKTNTSFEYKFMGYVNEPIVKISEPSHTKVNSDEGHSVSFIVEFIGEETASVDFKKVYWNGFNAELKSEKIGDRKYLLNFTNISGPVGKCYITVPNSVFIFENGAYSKQTTSQCFEIIEEYVTNYPIEIYLHIKKQQFIENGYILLEYGSYSGQNYLDYFDKSFIELYGFDADIAFDPLNNSILLNNITINTQSNVVPEILIKEGAFVSKENGSISKMISVYPLDYKEVPDSSIPAITMYRITNSESVFDVERGDSLVLNIIAADNYSCLINSDISTSIVENGFSYDEREIIVNGLAIQIIYSNVQPIEISGKCGVAVLEGTYTDMNGNESHKKTWPFKIVE